MPQTLFVLISLGLSKYFTASILTGLLVTSLIILIAGSGFGAMSSISPPNRSPSLHPAKACRDFTSPGHRWHRTAA